MSIQEQRRKAYEEWEIRENGYRPEDFSKVSGEYRHQVFRVRFECWNAALDSAVVQLPSAFREWNDISCEPGDLVMDADEVIKALEAAGLKVKP